MKLLLQDTWLTNCRYQLKKMAGTDQSESPWHVSTGHLPSPEIVATLVAAGHNRFKSNRGGKNSAAYPALERVQRDLFGVCLVDAGGHVYVAGDAEYEFTIMSVSKPFVFALVCQELGVEETRQKIGVNATGFAFNSLAGIERNHDGRTNPMVNSGAIATTSLVPGQTLEAKWNFLHERLSRFAGRRLTINEEVYFSASATSYRNHAIARLLQSYGRIYIDPVQAVDLYNKQCTLNVSAKDLAVMTTAGLYETSGDWLFDTGLPGKSGISGGMVSVSPGKGGLGTFAPPLDSAGNSVKGQLVAKFLSRQLGMDLFVSQPKI